MTPDEIRELRHELRTPVNHLIGYSELLLEEDGIAAATAQQLDAIRATARLVLELVPGLIADDGETGSIGGAEPVRALTTRVDELTAMTTSPLASPGELPIADVARLASATERLGELAARLTSGPVLVDRDTGRTTSAVAGRLEMVLVVDDDEANRDVLGRRLQKSGYGVIEAQTASRRSIVSPSRTPASTSCCSTR